MFLRTQHVSGHTYVQLVENARVDGKVTQRILHRFGRMDLLRESGQLDAIVAGLGRFSERLIVLGAHHRGESVQSDARRIGGPLVFERLWETTGIAGVMRDALADRHFGFPVERAVFLTVLHRLMAPGSDRAAERWKDEYVLPGTERLKLHHLYRAMAWLGEVLPPGEQGGATPFAPRTRKDAIEERLFATHRDLFTNLSLVFFDTTSIYFEGAGGETMGHYGHSKDHRPDRKQMVVGMVLDLEGRPLCCEIWPGNTTDVKSLLPIVDRLRTRFQIGRVCIVADRGMISRDVIEEIETRPDCWYILGVRMRAVKAMRELLAADEGPYDEVFPPHGRPKTASPAEGPRRHPG